MDQQEAENGAAAAPEEQQPDEQQEESKMDMEEVEDATGGDEEQAAEEGAKAEEPVENKAEYKAFYKQRTYAKYASKTLARAGERKILYAGPLRWQDLSNPLIREAVESAEQAQIRLLDSLKGEKFNILDLVMRSAEDAKTYCEKIKSTRMDDGWEVQASVQLDALKRGCRKPLMLYFIDYNKYKHEDENFLAELNFHNSYDRLHRLWVYIEQVPDDATDDELTSAIPNCLQAVIIRDEDGKNEGYGYGRFMTGRDRNKVFQEARSTEGIAFRDGKLKVFPINSDYDRVPEGEPPTVQALSHRLHKLQQTLKFQQSRNRRQRMNQSGGNPNAPPPLMDMGGGRGRGGGGYRGRGGGPMGGGYYNPHETAANLLYGLERLLGAGGGPMRGRGGGRGPPIENRLQAMASGGGGRRGGGGGGGGYRGGGRRGGYY